MKLEVTDIQRGCTHDGPGLRTTVFLKGCPLHCHWCHNPETQRTQKEFFYRPEKCIGCMRCVEICPAGAHARQDGMHIYDPTLCAGCMACTENCPSGALESASKTMTVEEVVEQVCLDKIFYRRRGGMTVSGGEPTLQKDGLLALLDGAKAEGIHTCLETCGVFPRSFAPELARRVDLFLYDMKDTDAARLKANTGADLELVTDNLKTIDALGVQSILRCILIPEVNMDSDHADALAQLYSKLSNCQHIELLPYHPYGLSKTAQLGREGIRYRQPEQAELTAFASLLQQRNIPVKLYGSLL